MYPPFLYVTERSGEKKNINIKKQIEGVKEFLLAQVNKYKIFIC